MCHWSRIGTVTVQQNSMTRTSWSIVKWDGRLTWPEGATRASGGVVWGPGDEPSFFAGKLLPGSDVVYERVVTSAENRDSHYEPRRNTDNTEFGDDGYQLPGVVMWTERDFPKDGQCVIFKTKVRERSAHRAGFWRRLREMIWPSSV